MMTYPFRWLIFWLWLHPLIVENYRQREAGDMPDELHWADALAMRWGFFRMTEEQHKQAVENVIATTFELAAKIGENQWWAAARALKQTLALDNAYMAAKYEEHMDSLFCEYLGTKAEKPNA